MRLGAAAEQLRLRTRTARLLNVAPPNNHAQLKGEMIEYLAILVRCTLVETGT
jgi:hypothetical protein